MYIAVQNNGKHRYVYLKTTFRENGKVKSKIIKNLGRYDELEKRDPDFLEKLKAKYDEPKVQAALEKEKELNQLVASINEDTKENTENDLTSNAAPSLCYGLEPVRALWKNELDLLRFFDYLQKQYSRYEFSIADASLYLTGYKLINPSSISGAYEMKHSFFASPATELKLHDFYRTLDFLSTYKEQIVKYLNKQLDKITNRTYSMVFYDVTNAYFETALSDEEKEYLDKFMYPEVVKDIDAYLSAREYPALERLKDKDTLNTFHDQLLLEGFSPDILFNDSQMVCIDALPDELYQEIRGRLYLRMRGLSKEHRYDLPLISIALIIDNNGFPVDYEIFSGNTSEFVSMKPSIEKIKERYKVKNTVVVADRGLNSTDNLKMLLDNGYGFIVAQKVSNLSDEIKTLMFDDSGYSALKDIPFEKYRYRVIDDFKKCSSKTGDCVSCKLIISYSADRYERDIKQLESDKEKAMEAVQRQTNITRSKRTWGTMVEVKDSTGGKAVAFNQAQYERLRQLCGYSAIVYHKAPSDSTSDISNEQISQAYHQLVKIEECFRILKNNICLRPMYVYSGSHIRGYVMICYLALISYRLLEYKLSLAQTPLSIKAISTALSNARLSPFKINEKLLFLHTSVYEELNSDKSDPKGEGKEDILNINKIMLATGLTPLYRLNTTANLNSLLKRKCPLKDMICDDLMKKL